VVACRPVDYRWDDAKAATISNDSDELEQLVYLSNLIGSDISLTQPGGGNSSVKRRETDFAGRPVDVLRVKGSGTDLRTIARRGFTGLRRDDLDHLRSRQSMSDDEMMAFMRACMLDTGEPAPSVETPLHSVLPYRFIVHTHDFATQALTDNPRPEATVRDALGDEAAYVDYVRPGFPLARTVIELGPVAERARGLVLGRHGLIAWGDSAKDCYTSLHTLIDRAERFIADRRRDARPLSADVKVAAPSAAQRRDVARALLPALRARLSRVRPVILNLDDSPEALAFAGAARAGEIAARGMSTPEHILRCGRLPLHVDAYLPKVWSTAPADAVAAVDRALDGYAPRYRETFERVGARAAQGAAMLEPAPRVVLLPGVGLVTAMKDKANAVVGDLC